MLRNFFTSGVVGQGATDREWVKPNSAGVLLAQGFHCSTPIQHRSPELVSAIDENNEHISALLA